MKSIVSLIVAPPDPRHLTAFELLEDFADATPSWCYLEDDSAHYAALRGRPACILRNVEPETRRTTDFAFSACDAASAARAWLVLVESRDTAGQPIASDEAPAEHFLQNFEAYLERRGLSAQIECERGELAHSASA